jgi:hypothetical protein
LASSAFKTLSIFRKRRKKKEVDVPDEQYRNRKALRIIPELCKE